MQLTIGEDDGDGKRALAPPFFRQFMCDTVVVLANVVKGAMLWENLSARLWKPDG